MASKLKYWSVTLLFLLTLGLTFERRAYAYTDPGSALMLFQSLGAVASGALFYFRRRLKRLFSRDRAAVQTAPAPAILSRIDS